MFVLVYCFIAVLGLILGSYLNSWVWREHTGNWKINTRSVCVHCSRELAWYENIPVASYLALRGKCRTCRGAIPTHYFWVELATPIIFLLVAQHHITPQTPEVWRFGRDIFFVALLITIFVYDYLYLEILPPLCWLGAALALGINLHFLPAVPGGGEMLPIFSYPLAMAISGGFFALQYIVSRGRWIGQGDIHLGVLMGALLGWPSILVALFFAYVIGAIVSMPLLVLKKKGMESEIPFGTFLTVGTFVALLWGERIVNWYLGLVRF